MNAVLAEVALPAWQVLLLIFLCCGSLIISLYCLLFMVPVKRFWERVSSLGGGMKGIQAHVEGVMGEVAKQIEQMRGDLQDLETRAAAYVEEKLRASVATVQSLQKDVGQLSERVAGVDAPLAEARSGVSAHAGQIKRMEERLTSLAAALEQMQGDFRTMSTEQGETVRRQVAESYGEIESTVLSALDAIQNEMLVLTEESLQRAEGAPTERQGSRPNQRRGSKDARSSKIIAPTLLFEVEKKGWEDEQEEEEGKEPGPEGEEE